MLGKKKKKVTKKTEKPAVEEKVEVVEKAPSPAPKESTWKVRADT